MNNNFSLARLGKLVVTDLASNKKQYVMWVGLVVAFMLAWTVISMLSLSDYRIEHSEGDPLDTSVRTMTALTLLVTAPIAASLTFNNLSSKTSRINALMLPALPIEKFVARWFIFVPLYLAVFLVAAQCVDFVRCAMEVVKVPLDKIHSVNVTKALFSVSDNPEDVALTVFWGVVGQSFFVLGSAVWPKMSIVKVACFWMAYGFLMTLYFPFVLIPIMDDYTVTVFDHVSQNTMVTLTYICGALWALVNYGVAYWRYRDTEIIQRW